MELLDKALGVHPYSLQLRLERAEIIAGNLANVDTPGFKARDIDFKQVMQNVDNQLESPVQSSPQQLNQDYRLKYRVPYQSSADGNTSELNVEQAKFAANTMDFESALTFLNMRISGLQQAIRGE